jgi:hypothetical protein
MSDALEVTLSPAALKRVARMQARAEGAGQVAQVAMQAAQQAQVTLQQTLVEECQDAGMPITADAQGQVDIDWRTGKVKLVAQMTPQGVPLPPGGNGVPGSVAEPAF